MLIRCIDMLRGLGQELDESVVYTRSCNHRVPLHLQLACFDGIGSSYTRHRDNAVGVRPRIV